jgi:AraC-like DNA-binding protein
LSDSPRTVHDTLFEMLSRSSDCNDKLTRDILSEVLQDLQLSGASYCRSELTEPWGLKFPPEEGAVFHFVAEGGCWLSTASQEPLRLNGGDVVLLPRGTGHALATDRKSATKRFDQLPRERVGETTYSLKTGGSGARSLLVCCAVAFEEPMVHPLLELMPDVLLVRGGGKADPALLGLLEAMAAEIHTQRIGGATVMTRLADIVITRVVRAWAEAQTEDTRGWLAAIRDARVGRVLAAVHRRPADAWPVASLAAIAHMSRSTFWERFTTLVGMPPARYVARWRMRLAGTWLRQERQTVSEVATRLGYESEAAFSRAFKRLMGLPPSAFRRLRTADRTKGATSETQGRPFSLGGEETRQRLKKSETWIAGSRRVKKQP